MQLWEYVVVGAITFALTTIIFVIALVFRSTAEVNPVQATFLLNAEEESNVERACLHERLAIPKTKTVKWSSAEGTVLAGVLGASLVTSVEVRTDGDEVTLRIKYIEVEPVTWQARKDEE